MRFSRLADYFFYFFGVLLIFVALSTGNVPAFLLGILMASPMLLRCAVRKTVKHNEPENGVRAPSPDILSLIFNEKEKRVVEALIKSPEPLRLSEITVATGLSKVTAYRLLRKLTTRGTILVLKDDAAKVKRYYINPKLKELFDLKVE